MAKLLLLGFMVSVVAGTNATSKEAGQGNHGAMENGNFLHCPCGTDCETDLGKQHGFQLLQGCGCQSCALRAADADTAEAPPGAGAVGAAEFVALLAEEKDWDAASAPGDSQLMFCRCGSLEKACRSCAQAKTRATCPCGTRCLRRLQWFGGAGWCIRRQCLPCR